MKKVFLGGTANLSTWRDIIMPKLKIDYFNPVVPEWNDAAYQRELHERATCDFCLYVLTPKLKGVYSIAEVIDDSNKRPEKTIFCIYQNDEGLQFSPDQYESMKFVGELVEKNGGIWLKSLDEVVDYLNSFA